MVKETLASIRSLGFKAQSHPAKSYFCEVKYAVIEVPPTIEVNLNKVDPGISTLRNIADQANREGYNVDFYNGNPFIKEHREVLRSEGYSV